MRIFIFLSLMFMNFILAAQQNLSVLPGKDIKSQNDAIIPEKHNWFVISDIGLLVGTVENEMKTPLSFNTLFSYSVYKAFHIGAGTGLEFYQMTYVPLIGEIRIKPSETGLSFFLQSGYAFPLNEKSRLQQGEFKFKPGFLLNPGISYTFPTTHRAAFTISIAYRYQKNESEQINDNQGYYYQKYEIINRMNRFNIRIGYTFR